MIIEACFLIVTIAELAFIAFVVLFLVDYKERIEHLESSEHALWGVCESPWRQ